MSAFPHLDPSDHASTYYTATRFMRENHAPETNPVSTKFLHGVIFLLSFVNTVVTSIIMLEKSHTYLPTSALNQ